MDTYKNYYYDISNNRITLTFIFSNVVSSNIVI